MDVVSQFLNRLSDSERDLISGFSTPAKIQEFLDAEVRYSPEEIDRNPLRVLRERIGHCLDGALFAAAMLRLLGFSPLVLQLLPNDRDDDHMVAVYRMFDCWGAIGQSNFVGLRFREPVYRTLRELVMSYFEDFFNHHGEKTLLGYRRPIHLARYDHLGWMVRDEAIPVILDDLAHKPGIRVISVQQQAYLSRMDERSRQAGLLGSDPAGLFAPGGPKPAYTRFPE